ncbi:MAG: DMT family transporter [Gemmobacter sp.]|uniref:DMT family transporter n=1 Tax=Gemmobacter sp. TaxID=1898957 RepID=UPI0039188E50
MTEGTRRVFGVALGLLATTGWAYFNIGTELARAEGFRPWDLTALRFGVAAVLLLPFFLWRGWRLAQRRVLLLALMVGPSFSLLFNIGFQLAPLSHAVVVGPGGTVLVALGLVHAVDGQRLSPLRVAGLMLLLAGLLAIGADRADETKASGWQAVLGDLCFVASGSLWGSYSWLLGRWRLPAVEVTSCITLYSALAFVPVWWLVWGVPDLPAEAWVHQVMAQGIVGGCLAPVTYAAAVAILGAGRGAVYNALLPPAAVLMAMPLTGLVPNALQWAGVALASAGLILSMALPARSGGATSAAGGAT